MFLLLFAVTVAGCRSGPVDTHALMLAEARRTVADFPDGETMQLTRFAHIGSVEAPEGRFHVVQVTAVLTGMVQPRWQHWLMTFDQDRRLRQSYRSLSYPSPLWCEGPRLYLNGTGTIHGIPHDPRQVPLFGDAKYDGSIPHGDVVDFSAGIDRPVMRLERRYGSTWGITHDPFRGLTG